MSKRLQKLREKWTEARLLGLKGVPSETAPDTIFDAVVSADPSSNHKYVDWCFKAWSRGAFQWEDIQTGNESRVADQLLRFETNKHKISDPTMRSLMKYKGPGELDAIMDAAGVSRTMSEFDMSSHQQKKMLMLKARLESIHHETESGLKFDIPLTEFASNILGRNTRWCTAGNNDNRFYEYAERGPLFIFTLPTGERFQGHIPTVVNEFWDTPDEERSNDGLRKAVVLSMLKSPSSYGIAEACDEITIMNENDTPITTEDYKKIDGYMDEILDIMLQATAKSKSITVAPNAISRLSKRYRELNQGVEPGPGNITDEELGQMSEEIATKEKSLKKENQDVSKRVSEFVDECASAIKPILKEAGYINETTALDLETFMGGFRRTSNPGFTLVREFVEQRISGLQDKHGIPEYKKESTVFNTIKKVLGGLKFKEGFIEGLDTSRHNYLFDLNIYKGILRNNIEDVIDRFPKEWGSVYLFRIVRDAIQHIGVDETSHLIEKLRENINPLQITLNRMIYLDIQAGQKKGGPYFNDFIANFDENYKKFVVKDKAAAISSAIDYYLSDSILQGTVHKNRVKDIDLSPCDFQKEDVVSLLDLLHISFSRTDIRDATMYHDYASLVMDYYNKKGISLNANDIMAFDMPEKNRRHQIQAALIIGDYNKEIKPGHPLYFLSEMGKRNTAYQSYTSAFLFSDTAEKRDMMKSHTVNVPRQDIEDTTIKAQLSCLVIVPNQKVLEAINKKGIGAAQEVRDYIVTELRRTGNDIGLIRRDATIGPLLINSINSKVDDMERRYQARLHPFRPDSI